MRVLWRVLPPWWVLAYYGVLLGALFWFVQLAENVYDVEGFWFDSVVLTWLNTHQSALFTRVALMLDFVGISYFLGVVLLVASVFVWRRSKQSVVFLFLGFWGAVGVNLVTKGFFERVRPDLFEQLTPITNSSFPSGHAMGSCAFWLTMVFVVRRLAPAWTWLAVVAGLVFTVLVGLSRMYLQVHYPSDVLAGWALSTVWVLGVAVWYTRGFRRIRVEQP